MTYSDSETNNNTDTNTNTDTDPSLRRFYRIFPELVQDPIERLQYKASPYDGLCKYRFKHVSQDGRHYILSYYMRQSLTEALISNGQNTVLMNR
jgi:hypothetical protein